MVDDDDDMNTTVLTTVCILQIYRVVWVYHTDNVNVIIERSIDADVVKFSRHQIKIMNKQRDRNKSIRFLCMCLCLCMCV